jgi:RecJ-like exonuclease
MLPAYLWRRLFRRTAVIMEGDTCPICGGDGRISNAFAGSTSTCPACHGTGRRSEHSAGLHDVTKTKPEHYLPPTNVQKAAKSKDWPETIRGIQLANEIRDSSSCEEKLKAKLIREVIDYERSHVDVTKTFITKVRKQLRPPPPR